MYKQIGVITGGGDAPGLNAVIRAVVRTATGEFGMKVVGIEDSFEGFMMGSNNPTLTNQTSSAIISALLATYATFCLRFSLFLSARRTWKNYAVIRM